MTDIKPMTDDADDRLGSVLDDPAEVKRLLMWIAVALLALFAVVAAFQVYTNVSTAIARFVSPDYRPLFQATFNLVVLLLAVAGISTLLKRLQAAS